MADTKRLSDFTSRCVKRTLNDRRLKLRPIPVNFDDWDTLAPPQPETVTDAGPMEVDSSDEDNPPEPLVPRGTAPSPTSGPSPQGQPAIPVTAATTAGPAPTTVMVTLTLTQTLTRWTVATRQPAVRQRQQTVRPQTVPSDWTTFQPRSDRCSPTCLRTWIRMNFLKKKKL